MQVAHERVAAFRALLRRPLMSAHQPEYALVRRHYEELRRRFTDLLGYDLVLRSDHARLRKQPVGVDSTRPARIVPGGKCVSSGRIAASGASSMVSSWTRAKPPPSNTMRQSARARALLWPLVAMRKRLTRRAAASGQPARRLADSLPSPRRGRLSRLRSCHAVWR